MKKMNAALMLATAIGLAVAHGCSTEDDTGPVVAGEGEGEGPCASEGDDRPDCCDLEEGCAEACDDDCDCSSDLACGGGFCVPLDRDNDCEGGDE